MWPTERNAPRAVRDDAGHLKNQASGPCDARQMCISKVSRYTFLAVALVVAAGCSKKAADKAPAGSASGSGSAVVASGSESGSGSAASGDPVAPPTPAKCTGAPQAFKGSCAGKYGCQEFTGSGFKADGSEYGAKEGCDAAKSKFSSTERCPAEKLIGRCLGNCGQSSELVTFEYAGMIEGQPDDEASRKKDCEQANGFWLSK